MRQLLLCALAAALMSSTALAQDVLPSKDLVPTPKKEYSPFVNDHFPTRPLFGDTHLHTSWSTDAGMPAPRWDRMPPIAFRAATP
jgi:hypothetical protein